jgi:hypothetical protein
VGELIILIFKKVIPVIICIKRICYSGMNSIMVSYNKNFSFAKISPLSLEIFPLKIVVRLSEISSSLQENNKKEEMNSSANLIRLNLILKINFFEFWLQGSFFRI